MEFFSPMHCQHFFLFEGKGEKVVEGYTVHHARLSIVPDNGSDSHLVKNGLLKHVAPV